MFHFGWKLNPPQRAGDLLFETEATRFLESDHDLFRIIRGPGGENVLPPNSPAVYGLADAQGYSSLTLAYYGEFMELIEPGIANPRRIRALKSPSSLMSELLDFLNVKYVLVGPEVNEELAALDRGREDVELVYDGEIKIYENRDVLPRAYVVTSYIVAEDRGEVLELLRDEGFDPATQVILEEQPLIDSTGTAMTGGESQVDVVEYGPSRVIMEASLHDEGLVVLSEVYYPGGKALVDGVEREIYRANYAFRAVPVESGSHHVELVYDPTSFKMGLGLSACALAVIVGSSCWLLVKRARVRAPDPLEAAKHEG